MYKKLLLDNHSFRNFFFGQLVSQLGDRINALALIWLVYHWSGSAAMVGGIMIGATLPGILVAPYAGTVIDRYEKKRIMIIADVVRFVVLGFVAIAAYLDFLNYTILILSTAVVSVASAFFNPAALSIMPNLVKGDKALLTSANALSQIGMSVSAVVGPIVGSALIVAIGVTFAFLINAISFLLSIYFLLNIKQKLSTATTSKQSWLKDLGEVKRVFTSIPLLKQLIFPVILVNLFLCAITIMLPVLADLFESGTVGMGWLMAAFGAGMLIGTLILSAVNIRISERNWIVANFVLMGTALLTIGLGGTQGFGLLGCALAGLSLNMINIKLIVLFQILLPEASRGKVMAVIAALSLSSQPISYALTGVLLDIINPLNLLMICGVGVIAVGIRVYYLNGWKSIHE